MLGSSGYIGVNLVQNLAHDQVVRVAGMSPAPGDQYSLDLSMRILEDDHSLYGERPTDVYVLARPVHPDYESNRVFYLNLQSLLLNWCDFEPLRSIKFLSTTTLYSIENQEAKSSKSPVAPYGAYEYFKLETELFLDYLSRNFRSDVDFTAIRIPIAFGGLYHPGKNQNQFLYSFINSYRHGWTWRFDLPGEEQFGSSWIHTPDLVAKLAESSHQGSGYSLQNAASGFFTYKWLHELLERKLNPEKIDDLHLFRSRMRIEDEFDMPQRNLQEVIERFLRARGMV